MSRQVLSERSFPVSSPFLHDEWASLGVDTPFSSCTTNWEIAMTTDGRNHAVSNPSRESGTARHAEVRRNDEDHGASPDDQIRVCAYERYIAGGKQPSDLRDWLDAERAYQERL
jgi:hypothetical protein